MVSVLSLTFTVYSTQVKMVLGRHDNNRKQCSVLDWVTVLNAVAVLVVMVTEWQTEINVLDTCEYQMFC